MKNNNKFHKILVVDVYTIMIHIYIILFFKAIPCWGIQSYDFWAIHLRHWRCEVERHWRKGTPQGPAIYAAVSGCLKMPKPRESWEHQQIVTVNKKFPVLSIMSIVCMCFPKNVGEVNWSHPFDNILKGYDYLMAQQRQMICKTLTRKPGLNLGWCIMLLSLEIGVSRTWRISQPLDFTDSKQVNWCDWGFLEHKTEVFWTRHVRNSPAMTSVSRWQLNPCFSTSPGNGNKCPHFSWSKP